MYVNEPFGLRATLPWAGLDASAAVSGLPSGSVSFASTPLAAFTVSGVALGVLYASLTATGALLTVVTVIETVAVLLLRAPSFARYVKESGPV